MLSALLEGDEERVALLSHWIRIRQSSDKPPLVASSLFGPLFEDQRLPSPSQQCELLIRWLGAASGSPGRRVEAEAPPLKAEIGALNDHGLVFILNSLQQRDLISWKHFGRGFRLQLTLGGWEAYGRLEHPLTVSTEGAAGDQRDAFICHAGEDKISIVQPLRAAFDQIGITYWYDNSEIRWGDSLTQQVNAGLAISRFVLVVLSPAFMRKPWPQRELYAALGAEAASGSVKVLPLLCGTAPEQQETLERLPLMRDKLHLVWSGDAAQVVEALLTRLRPA